MIIVFQFNIFTTFTIHDNCDGNTFEPASIGENMLKFASNVGVTSHLTQ